LKAFGFDCGPEKGKLPVAAQPVVVEVLVFDSMTQQIS
jgi:hypothetical protein